MLFATDRLRHTLSILVFVVCLSVTLSAEASNVLAFTGTARDLKTGALLYKEVHSIQRDNTGRYLSGTVAYFSPDNALMAEKKIEFGASLSAPSLVFEDLRQQRVVRVDVNADTVTIDTLSTKNLSTKTLSSKTPSSETLSTDTQMSGTVAGNASDKWIAAEASVERAQPALAKRPVIDAGFDRYVVAEWDALMRGKTVKFDFLALSRGVFVPFQISLIETEDGVALFDVKPRNVFFRFLVEPIQLKYDVAKRRLLAFSGLTNIEIVEDGKGAGENHVAVIEYTYNEQ